MTQTIPTKDEILIMIANAPEHARPLIFTALFTGMRIGELRGLTWDRIDFKAKRVHVWMQADRSGRIGRLKRRARRRFIPLAPIVVSTLQAWKRRCPPGDLGLVFPNGKGRVENHANIHNRVLRPLLIANRIVDEDGNPKFGFHALRHAAASLFIAQSLPPEKIQTLMGHTSIKVTMDTYGHLFERPEEDLAA